MEADFWKTRWRNNELGWHQAEYNRALVGLWPTLNVPAAARVLVPFCGKSLDMRWLAARGHGVVGVELAARAVKAFFAEWGVAPKVAKRQAYRCYRHDGIEIFQGDFFTLPPREVGIIGGAYDRGGLVALPPEMRRRYAPQLVALCASGAPILLLAVEYEGGPGIGPPFSVGSDELERLFRDTCTIDVLERRTDDQVPPGLAAQGVGEITQAVYRLTVR